MSFRSFNILHCIYAYMKLPHLFQCIFFNFALISLKPDVAQSIVIYPRNQGDEIFKKNQVWSRSSCAEKYRAMAYGQLALAFYSMFHVRSDFNLERMTIVRRIVDLIRSVIYSDGNESGEETFVLTDKNEECKMLNC